jgi:signal transduction histidine kinase
MRRLLRVLRAYPSSDLVLQPQMVDIPALATQIEATGLPVELVVTGTPRPLPAGVELCAYRIVQEALTNALKYAGPARVTVCLDYRPDGVDVLIRDDGRGIAAELGSGQGLVGMRERAMLLGGWLAFGAAACGGVQVHAFLPVGAPCRDAAPP